MKKVSIILLSILGLVLVIGFAFRSSQEVRGKFVAQSQPDEMTATQQAAQALAFASPEVQKLIEGHRYELFGVRQVLAGQFTEAASACATAVCQQVEIYLWDTDTAVTVLVNSDTNELLDVLELPGMHPGINQRLANRALEIATNDPQVIAALGYKPSGADMAPVDADMIDTVCDGDHLCVGPTFNIEEKGLILWAIVDLTDERLVDIAYTEAGESGTTEFFTPDGCPAPGSVDRDGWTLDYATTGTDGLNVYNVEFNEKEVATSIKLVEWHVAYPTFGYRDSTGCGGGGGGFPIYPFGETEVRDLQDGDSNVIGFEVVQDFRMSNWGAYCNYRYEQHLQFFQDGSFRVVGGAFGQGCGTVSTYRPVTRIDIAVDGDANDSFSRWDGTKKWQQLNIENYLTPYTEAGHGPHLITTTNGISTSWRVDDTVTGAGYYIQQDVGQFDGEAGRGAEPFWYVTLHKSAEGDTDLGVIGSCCNENHEQGPEQYIDGEDVGSENIVLWYVSQMDTVFADPDYYCWTNSGDPNPDTYPCFAGPLFVPTGNGGIPPVASFTHNGPIEPGETAVFNNTSLGSIPITYEWDFGDGSPITATVSPTHTYTLIDEYTVVLTATNNIGYNVFTDTITVGDFVESYLPAIMNEE